MSGVFSESACFTMSNSCLALWDNAIASCRGEDGMSFVGKSAGCWEMEKNVLITKRGVFKYLFW